MTQGADIMETASLNAAGIQPEKITLNAESIQKALSDQNYEQSLRNSRIDTHYWKQYNPAWNQTAAGRLASRLISRGVVGAAFYVVGGHYAAKNMATYDPTKRPTTAYQWIAYGIDKFISRPIEAGVNKVNGKGKSFVSFRPTLKDHANRSLGEEVIRGNADFAMASMGDALGREIIGMVDAGRRKAWHDEKGNLSLTLITKHMGRTLFNVIIAQCPDWFVSVPYAFQQKFQRKVLNRWFPGFEAAGDSTLHGANHRVDKDGKLNGTYALAGAIDLQARFTGYNWGTGAFQDMVNAGKRKFSGEKPETAPDEPKKSFLKRTVEWGVVRSVKTMLIMTPSVPLFSLFRVPQGKHRGIAIDPDGNSIIREDLKGDASYQLNKDASWLDKLSNPFGKIAYKFSSKAKEMQSLSSPNHQGLVENWVNASLAYTPYIYAKNELQHHFDTPEMDRAILKMAKNLVKGRMGEAKEGMADMIKAMRPKSTPPPHIQATHHIEEAQKHVKPHLLPEGASQSHVEKVGAERSPFTPEAIMQSRQSPEAKRQSASEAAASATDRIAKERENAAGARIAAGV